MIYKKWIVAIKRDEGPEFQVGKSTKVCSKHFRSSDFIPSVGNGRSLFRDSAVPSVFAFSKEKKERKPTKPRASPQVRSQNPVLGPGVLGDELMHSPDEVKAAPVGLEEPTRLNSSLEGENARLAKTIKQKNNEIARLRDKLCQIKEQLVAAKGIIGQLGFEKASLSCQLAAERERTAPFTVERFKDCDEDMLFYTGLPSYNHFKKLLVYLNPGDDGCNVLRSERAESSEPRSSRGRKRKLSTESELFLVLVRLRLGLFEDDLAHRFCIAQSTVSRICTSWINFLYAKLGLLPLWAPRRIVDATMPPEFKEKYSSTRVILDATEIQCEVPSSLSLQSTTYSPYKSSNTFKGLIGVLPNGLVAFVSELFTGSSSDRECVIRSVFLDLKFDDEDAVMADKGFRIEDLLEKNGVKLNLPPFLKGGTFSPEEVKSTKEIAALRIHVERRIQRIKAFHIFDRPIPLTLAPLINQIWTVTAILSNFQSSLIQQSSGKPQQEP
ncbi:uncharacterized protein LOC119164629 [Rhipicephalus microplus]|uniref:uncharacterized protein LOC119164629 n=1 Tax=Rhipicephalus microplus TaxID=6941 RepID=UPI003F6B8F42